MCMHGPQESVLCTRTMSTALRVTENIGGPNIHTHHAHMVAPFHVAEAGRVVCQDCSTKYFSTNDSKSDKYLALINTPAWNAPSLIFHHEMLPH